MRLLSIQRFSRRGTRTISLLRSLLPVTPMQM